MPEAVIITPVKDLLLTTNLTLKAISEAKGEFEYYVFNDFSQPETNQFLEKSRDKYGFHLIHLENITNTPSSNYKLVLQIAQQIALGKNCPLITIESDVFIKPDTVIGLFEILKSKPNQGLIGAITVDEFGKYNVPYAYEKVMNNQGLNTSRSLSFFCTIISLVSLLNFVFKIVSQNKDWFDVYISRQSKKPDFNNCLAKGIEVVHLPHSSRTWKHLKYAKPLPYYFNKIFYKRVRI